jgi:hypothetical protein
MMREEFVRSKDAWENGVAVEDVLEHLKAKITEKK